VVWETLNPEDEIALRFSRILEKLGIEYVVVAGYIAILFGRGCRTEDIDFIVMPLTEDMFVDLCREVSEEGFRLMQGDVRLESSVRSVYRDYLANGYSVRFMYGDVIFPNIEFKFSSTTIHKHALNNSYRVVINDEYTVKISPTRASDSI